jgi:hypothetical protein
MIIRKTVIDQIEVARTGHLQIRLALLLIEDGVEVDSKWHRTAIEPGGDLDAQIALVNAHLLQMKRAEINDAAGLQRVRDIIAVVHTPDVVTEFREREAATEAAIELA